MQSEIHGSLPSVSVVDPRFETPALAVDAGPGVEVVPSLAHARGEYIVFAAPVRPIDRDQLRHQAAYLTANPDRSYQNWLGLSGESGVPDDDRYLEAEDVLLALLARGEVPPPTVMLRRAMLLRPVPPTVARTYGHRPTADLRLLLSAHVAYPMQGPEYVQIGPVDACNARCLFCVHHSPLVEREGPPHKGMLVWAAWRRLLDDIAALGTQRIDYIGIGEPLMHPRIDDALAHGSRRFAQYMVSNGLLLRRHLDAVADHVDWLSVSLNAVSPRTQHALHLTGERGFETTVGAIRELVSRRQRRGQVSISFVVNKLNFREVADLPRFCEELGVRVWLNPIGLYDDTRAPLGLTPDEQRELNDILDRLAEMPDHSVRNLPEFRQFEGRDTTYIVDQLPCYLGLMFAQIRGDGSVSHCCACEHTPVGNINDAPFSEIWVSETYRRFRRDALFTIMETRQSLPGCHCDICGLAPESVRMHNRLYGTAHTLPSLKASAAMRHAPEVRAVPATLYRAGGQVPAKLLDLK